MEYRIIQAPNMKLAMLKIHQELGPDAMICRTRKTIGGIEVLAGLAPQKEEDGVTITNAVFAEDLNSVKVLPNDAYLKERLQELNHKIDMLSNRMTNKKSKWAKLRSIKLLNFIRKIISRIRSADRNKLGLQYILAKNKIHTVVNTLKSIGLKGKFEIKNANHLSINNKRIKALIGPPGVGKTTTIIKIAEQFSMKNESSDIAIISTNADDIYIKSKLCHYCELYDISYQHVSSRQDLSDAINKLADKRLILIDTHGLSQRDVISINKLKSVLDNLKQKIDVYLTLPASQQPEVIEDCIKCYRFKRITGCILTKVDEVIRMEPALETIVKCKLPIRYLTNGEDLDGDIYMLSEMFEGDVFNLDKLTKLNINEINLDSIIWG